MRVEFGSAKLERVLSDAGLMDRQYGQNAKRIRLRLAVLLQAQCLADVPAVPPERRHQLAQDRDEQFAVDLKHPHRMVFEVANEPIPLTEDGGIDLKAVTAVRITEIIDYH